MFEVASAKRSAKRAAEARTSAVHQVDALVAEQEEQLVKVRSPRPSNAASSSSTASGSAASILDQIDSTLHQSHRREATQRGRRDVLGSSSTSAYDSVYGRSGFQSGAHWSRRMDEDEDEDDEDDELDAVHLDEASETMTLDSTVSATLQHLSHELHSLQKQRTPVKAKSRPQRSRRRGKSSPGQVDSSVLLKSWAAERSEWKARLEKLEMQIRKGEAKGDTTEMPDPLAESLAASYAGMPRGDASFDQSSVRALGQASPAAEEPSAPLAGPKLVHDLQRELGKAVGALADERHTQERDVEALRRELELKSKQLSYAQAQTSHDMNTWSAEKLQLLRANHALRAELRDVVEERDSAVAKATELERELVQLRKEHQNLQLERAHEREQLAVLQSKGLSHDDTVLMENQKLRRRLLELQQLANRRAEAAAATTSEADAIASLRALSESHNSAKELLQEKDAAIAELKQLLDLNQDDKSALQSQLERMNRTEQSLLEQIHIYQKRLEASDKLQQQAFALATRDGEKEKAVEVKQEEPRDEEQQEEPDPKRMLHVEMDEDTYDRLQALQQEEESAVVMHRTVKSKRTRRTKSRSSHPPKRRSKSKAKPRSRSKRVKFRTERESLMSRARSRSRPTARPTKARSSSRPKRRTRPATAGSKGKSKGKARTKVQGRIKRSSGKKKKTLTLNIALQP